MAKLDAVLDTLSDVIAGPRLQCAIGELTTWANASGLALAIGKDLAQMKLKSPLAGDATGSFIDNATLKCKLTDKEIKKLYGRIYLLFGNVKEAAKHGEGPGLPPKKPLALTVKPQEKDAVPTWVYYAGAGAVLFLLLRR